MAKTKKTAAKKTTGKRKVAKARIVPTQEKAAKAPRIKNVDVKVNIKIGAEVSFKNVGRGIRVNHTGKVIAKVPAGMLPSDKFQKLGKNFKGKFVSRIKQARNFETYLVAVDNSGSLSVYVATPKQLAA